MEQLAHIAKVEIVLAVALIYGAVIYRLLTGGIHIAGLLDRKTGGGLDPGRLQALVVSLLVGMSVLLNTDGSHGGQILLPSHWLLALVGGSHGLYLHEKDRQVKNSGRRRGH